MLVCGREEPIGPNEFIYQATARADYLAFSDVRDDRLNRYSFVWIGSRSEAADRLTRLLRAVLSAWNAGGMWLAVYHPENQAGLNLRLYFAANLRKRTKEGWDTWDNGSLGLAVRPLGEIQEDATVEGTRLLPGHELRYPSLLDDKPLLVIGPAFSASSLAQAVTQSALSQLGPWRIAPSRAFLEWLAETERTLIYPETSHGNHLGLIVVGMARIDVDELVSGGLVASIEDGESAGHVWWHAPS